MTALSKVSPGDPLVIPAADYNAFVDAAVAHRQSQLQQRGHAPVRQRMGYGVITASTPIEDADNRWHYTVQLKLTTDPDDGTYIENGEALENVLSENELENTDTHINGGQPLVLKSMSGTDGKLEVLPLADGTSVTVAQRGEHWYILGRNNPTDYECAEEEEEES